MKRGMIKISLIKLQTSNLRKKFYHIEPIYRLMIFESSYWRNRLAPRCRLIISWWSIRCQGFGCSPNKMVRELGSKRCETVWSLSTVHNKKENYKDLSTRGPETIGQLSIIVIKFASYLATPNLITHNGDLINFFF